MMALLPFALQCAMCYQNASQQGAKGMAALNAGILILLAPPVAILGCISFMTYRRVNRDKSEPPGRAD